MCVCVCVCVCGADNCVRLLLCMCVCVGGWVGVWCLRRIFLESFFVDVEDVTLVHFLDLQEKVACTVMSILALFCVWPRGCLWQVWTFNIGINYLGNRS